MREIPLLEVEFKGRRKEFAANPMEFPFLTGDFAVFEVERGHDLGRVSHLGLRPGLEGTPAASMTALRKATIADLKLLEQNHQRELEAKQAAKRRIADHHLEMKLVDVELQWDGRKMTFYFSADGRVDFRKLVKDLASSFRTRIDLRQIGARDETKKTGGYGICGRPLCCATFLQEFKPITTQMPRDQFLPLNPSKLSGVCGRLKCCLRYELDVYREFQRTCPKVGHPVRDEAKGDGVIDKLDVLREQIHIRYSQGDVERVSPQEFVQISNWRPEMPKNECICTCGRKTPASVQVPEPSVMEEPAPPDMGSGERVTLHGEGGMSFSGSGSDAVVHVGSDFEVERPAEDKPHKKRRRGKRPSGQTRGPDQAIQASKPAAAAPPRPPIPRPEQLQQRAQTGQAQPQPGQGKSKHRRRGRGRGHGQGGGEKPTEQS